MFPMQDQISEAAKANLAAHYALYSSLANQTFDSTVRLINLNVTAMRATLEESALTAKQLLAAKDPQELFTMVAAQAKPNLEKALAYSNHIVNITSSAQAEITQVAEKQFAAMRDSMSYLVDNAASKAPAESQDVVSMMKTAINNANENTSQLAKAGKQAVETAEASVTGAVNQAASSSQAAAPSLQTAAPTKH
jgi:phasin family protein